MNPKPIGTLVVLIFAYFFFPLTTFGQHGIDSEFPFSSQSKFITTDYWEIWIDSLAKFTNIEQISSQPFQKIAGFKLDSPKDAYWIRFEIENYSRQPKKYWLEAGVFDSLTLIQKKEPYLIDIQHRGLLINYEGKQKNEFQSLLQDKYGFEIVVPPKVRKTYFLRIKNNIRFETPISNIQLLGMGEKVRSSAKQLIYYALFSAAFFGIFFFFILLSIFQYFQNRDLSYFYYALYLSLSAAYFWWKFEKSNSFLNIVFTNCPNYYYYFEVPLGMLIYISYFLFIIHFLNAKKDLPAFYKILKVAIPALLIYLVGNIGLALIVGLPASWELNYWVRFILIPIGIFAIWQVFTFKHQLGFYILTGTLIMLLGAALTTIFSKTSTQHYIGPWDMPLLPIQIGMLIEIIFFSAGLAYKSQLAVKEKTSILLDFKQQQKEAEFYKNRQKELSSLYSNISHEFRTPLTVILGAIQQISGHRREKDIIRRNGKQLLRLVNQVLDLNKLEVKKMTANWKQADIMRFVRYCTESFEFWAKKKQINLEIFCYPNRLIMDFDPEKLQKVLNNLLSNAIKFTPENGSVRIDTYQVQERDHSIFRIEISDSGKGIPSEYHAFVFDPYTQLPNTEGGTGLGLALAKELTLCMGGSIQLNSEPGKGSTFRLSFPIHKNAILAPILTDFEKQPLEGAAVFEKAQPIEFISGRPSLLLVEDNLDVQLYLKQLLKPGYNIFSANNGKEGIEVANEIRPDIILCDVMMPEMNGYDFCDHLKKNVKTQHIPIILLTAKASRQDRLKGLENKADAYLTKPFDEKELLLRIEQLLQKNKILEARSANVFVKNGLIPKAENGAVVFMEKFHAVLNKNLQDEKFKIKDLCQEMRMNHVSINNKIKKHTGQTTAQYIRNYRLNLAKELLQRTELSVAEISYKVGIPEPSNFNNMFKKAFGKSPKQWKKG